MVEHYTQYLRKTSSQELLGGKLFLALCTWIISYWESNGNLPHSDVVVDLLCIDNREIYVDAVPRRYSDGPHAVLKVWILGWVSRWVNCAIHGCYISTTESWRERRKSEMLDKNRKPAVPQVIKLAFMAVLPQTVDKTNRNSVLLGYRWDTGGRMHLLLQEMVTGCCELDDADWFWHYNSLRHTPSDVLKFDFELGVKAKALPSGSKTQL